MEQKDAYWEMQRAKLQQIGKQMERLETERGSGTDNGEDPHEALLRGLRAEREAAEEKLNELKAAGANAWEDLRSGIEKAVAELQEGVEKAISQFRQKG